MNYSFRSVPLVAALVTGCAGAAQPVEMAPGAAEVHSTVTGDASGQGADAATAPSAESAGPAADTALNPALQAYVATALPETANIDAERKQLLEQIAAWVTQQRASGQPAKLVFICTHNSRRSHMSQLWAAAAAAYHGLDGVETYSGGTEATAFNPRAVAALRRAGFAIEAGAGENPHYQVRYADGAPAQECFSKKYDDPFNPSDGFAAIMTCSAADSACPFVTGAAERMAIPYIDPKVSDGTPEEAATYDARVRQIATEMLYLFSQVRS